ncbi:MAG: signal recognition particle protein Srp19 [Methanobacterium sp.]|uniref:signal recognition particle subunit SRP19/SEC65 family protein n=1 Tax=Methanobacterium sp. TaxID=2164 RepID=UPI003D650350|nr:signal recognition particle protein Srp19 [Methanobacterium sp.]
MRTIIWPVYIDSEKTKKEGRRVSKENGVPSPKLREISNAAKKLQLNPETENSKSYSRSWWESSGRVTVDKNMPKREVLIKISNMIKGMR